jgi:large subunit ribosomal protein L15
MKLNEISDRPGALKVRKRIGRGIGSGKGKTGGRGGKGQTARSGVAIKGFEGGQMPMHRRLPKRGFRSLFRRDLNAVSLDRIQAALDAGKLAPGKTIDVTTLVEVGVCRSARDGVKILLGRNELKAPLALEVAGASRSAVAAIEKAGGSVKILAMKEVAAAT